MRFTEWRFLPLVCPLRKSGAFSCSMLQLEICFTCIFNGHTWPTGPSGMHADHNDGRHFSFDCIGREQETDSFFCLTSVVCFWRLVYQKYRFQNHMIVQQSSSNHFYLFRVLIMYGSYVLFDIRSNLGELSGVCLNKYGSIYSNSHFQLSFFAMNGAPVSYLFCVLFNF
jgi:hypothetical protein